MVLDLVECLLAIIGCLSYVALSLQNFIQTHNNKVLIVDYQGVIEIVICSQIYGCIIYLETVLFFLVEFKIVLLNDLGNLVTFLETLK